MSNDEPQSIRLRELALRQHIAETLLLRVIMTSDQHEVIGGSAVELVAQLGDAAAETLDRFDAQMIRRLHARRRHGRQSNARKLHELLENAGHREQTGDVGGAFEIVLALLFEIAE